eukprot:1158717-Pelagomonas_calceolata.AAC.3
MPPPGPRTDHCHAPHLHPPHRSLPRQGLLHLNDPQQLQPLHLHPEPPLLHVRWAMPDQGAHHRQLRQRLQLRPVLACPPEYRHAPQCHCP